MDKHANVKIMKLREIELPGVYLKPGEWYFAHKPTLIVTVLGSCVGVAMYSRRRKLGALCHGLLPKCGDEKLCARNCKICFHYVDCSIARMLEQFHRQGVEKREIEIKVFGGSTIIGNQHNKNKFIAVGTLNAEMAFLTIKNEQLRLVASDVGGSLGRKIYFNTETGEILLKRVMRLSESASITKPPSASEIR